MPGPISKRSGAAVVVGISDYLHAGRVPRLGYAAVDARAVFRALVDPDVCNFPTENVLLLTDKEATSAIRDHFIQVNKVGVRAQALIG